MSRSLHASCHSIAVRMCPITAKQPEMYWGSVLEVESVVEVEVQEVMSSQLAVSSPDDLGGVDSQPRAASRLQVTAL